MRLVPGDTTRPITDRAKESLFNILSSDIQGAALLDLFAGTGSVGIEALSRGAGYVRFNDQQRLAVETIRANLVSTRLSEAGEVMHMDAFALLSRPADRSFEYIFIAPPQYKELWNEAIRLLDRRPDWLAEDAWVIVQIHPVEYKDLKLHHLVEFDQRQYGSVLLVFYERQTIELEQEPSNPVSA